MSRTADTVYKRRREELKRQPNLTCVLCGQSINIALPQYDPLAFHADHIDPVGTGGHNRGPLQPMHAQCNRKRGVKPLDAVRVDPHTRTHY